MLELVKGFVAWVLNLCFWCGTILGGIGLACFIILGGIGLACLLINKVCSLIEGDKRANKHNDAEMAAASPTFDIVCGDNERIAGCLRRWLARMIDGVLFGTIAVLLLMFVVFPWIKWTAYESSFGPGQIKERFLFYYGVISLLLEGGFWALFRTTPGKWLFGIRVLTEEGLPVSGSKYAMRMLGMFMSVHCLGLGTVLPNLGGLCVLRQAYVVYKSPVNRASYDEELHLNVVSRPLSKLRILVIGIVIVCLAAIEYGLFMG